MNPVPSTYAAAGVNIEAGNDVVRRIKPHAQRTYIPGVLAGLGGFGALFQHDFAQYQEPILVSSTDGVGTKLKVAFDLGRHDTVGRDLVAMCVNDLICCGARPLFFLDYFATGRLSPAIAENVVKGIADGCVEAGCALIGGETAELPGFYQDGEYDLAGFTVGVVDKGALVDGSGVKPGDAILGLASTGLHSNGYSLGRKLLEPLGYGTFHPELGTTVGAALLEPTQIYVKPLLKLLQVVQVAGLANITGGGFYENIPRAMAPGTVALIQRDSWRVLPLFKLIQQEGKVAEREMFTTFNMGIGLVAFVPAAQAPLAMEVLCEEGIGAVQIGTVGKGTGDPYVELVG